MVTDPMIMRSEEMLYSTISACLGARDDTHRRIRHTEPIASDISPLAVGDIQRSEDA